MKDKPQKIRPETITKLKTMRRKLEDEGVPYFERTNIHLIGVAVDKMEMVVGLIPFIEQSMMELAKTDPTEQVQFLGSRLLDILAKANAFK